MTDPTAIRTQRRIVEFDPRALRIGAQPLGVWVLGIVAWFAMGLVAPFIGSESFFDTITSTAGILSFFTIQWSAIRLTGLILSGRPRYMAINFWAFVYLFFGLAGFMQVDAGIFTRRLLYIGSDYSRQTLATAQLIVIVGFLAYELGSFLLRQRTPKRFAIQPRGTTISLGALHALAMVALAAGTLFIVKTGGSLFGTRDSLDKFSNNGVNNSIRMLLFAAAFLICYTFRRGRIYSWKSQSLLSRTAFISCVVVCLIVNNPTTTQRASFAAVAGGLTVAMIGTDSKKIVRLIIIGLILTTVFAYPALNAFRRADPQTTSSVVESTNPVINLRSADGNFGMFTQVADGVEYLRTADHSYGRFLLSSSLVFVPRSIWTSKSYDVGDTIHDHLGYATRYNYSSPLWEESYVEGGYLWVLVVFVILGAVSTLLDLRFIQIGVGRLAIITPAIAFYQPYILRGSLLASTPMLYALVLSLLLVIRRAPLESAESVPRDAISVTV